MQFTHMLSGSLLALALLVGCESTGPTADTTTTTEPSLAHDTTPITGSSATLWMTGMSCPKCANSINLLLKEVPGVASTDIDMSTGEVQVLLAGAPRPSPADLARAVNRSGFTLSRITVP